MNALSDVVGAPRMYVFTYVFMCGERARCNTSIKCTPSEPTFSFRKVYAVRAALLCALAKESVIGWLPNEVSA